MISCQKLILARKSPVFSILCYFGSKKSPLLVKLRSSFVFEKVYACTRILCMHKNLNILTCCDKHLILLDSHILTRDPSRMVREGLRSILGPLNNISSHTFFKYWVLVLLIMAYCLLPFGLPLGLSIGSFELPRVCI